MNPYFWFFAIWAALITPVTVHAGIRVGRAVSWRLQLQFAGLPFVRKETQECQQEEQTADLGRIVEALKDTDGSLAALVFRSGGVGRFFKSFRLDRMEIYLKLSFEDAAVTALLYALIRNVLQTLALCGAMPRRVEGRVEMDFHARGTELQLQGIISCRLGTLGLAAGRLLWAILRTRAKRLTAEEEGHAAASH